MRAALLALTVAVGIPSMTVEREAKGFVIKVAKFDLREQAAVDAEIDRRAGALCGDRQVHWGEFSSTAKLGKHPASDPAPVTGYSKKFSCIAADKATYTPAPADWVASAADEKDAIAFFNTYYAKRDRGDFAGAFSMFHAGILGDSVQWSHQMAAENKKIGVGKRRVTGVTWYANPDGAPHPGIYVAIDFVGDFPSTYFYCGYLALYRRGAGSYEITREEQNMYTHGESVPDAAQVAQMRASMCRGE